MAPKGVFIPLEFGLTEIRQALVTALTGGRRVVIGVNGDSREDLAFVATLLASGEVRPVIDSRYSLERIADAHRRVEGRHKTGSVVVTGAQPESLRLVA
jgi:NADPH:quinone reductase-like Zn-dependent oxidoreductase